MWYFRFIGPIFDALSEEYTDIEFVKVDVDKAHKVKALCGIHAMPTFQFFKNGEIVEQVVGASQDKLTAVLDKLVHGTPDREAELQNFHRVVHDGEYERCPASAGGKPGACEPGSTSGVAQLPHYAVRVATSCGCEPWGEECYRRHVPKGKPSRLWVVCGGWQRSP